MKYLIGILLLITNVANAKISNEEATNLVLGSGELVQELESFSEGASQKLESIKHVRLRDVVLVNLIYPTCRATAVIEKVDGVFELVRIDSSCR